MTGLETQWSKLWLPPERLPLSQWSEKNFFLSPEYANRTGEIKLFGWQREIFDSFTDPRVLSTVIMSGTQLVKTLFLQAAIAYVVSEDPGPSLLLQPNNDDAKAFSRERLDPMARDCPCLKGRITEPKSRDGTNTLVHKTFPGGSLSLTGTLVPGNLARRSIRYLFADEIDLYPISAGGKGDPIVLAEERQSTYQTRRKSIFACSPTTLNKSAIARRYAASDQRKPWARCHKCGRAQILKWAYVKWDNSLPVELVGPTVRYECQFCREPWNDLQRKAACDKAEWRASAPFAGVAGFWISHLYSPWKDLSDIVRKFLAEKDDKRSLQVFINTNLAELWEDEGERPDWEKVRQHREHYKIGDECTVPNRAVFLTAGVDVQEFRLECEVVAWAPGKESWSVDYRVFEAFDSSAQPIRTSAPDVWRQLSEFLARTYKHQTGADMPILAMAIDVGHNATPVYEFCRAFSQPAIGPAGIRVVSPRTVLCVRGYDKEHMVPIKGISNTDASRRRRGIRILTLGTGYLKQQLYDMLRIPQPKDGAARAGYAHFPDYGEEYFRGLASEKRIVHEDGSATWEKIYGRNEPLDCRIYATGAAVAVGIERFQEQHWRDLRRNLLGDVIQEDPKPAVATRQEQIAPQVQQRIAPPPQSNSWFGNRSGWLNR